MNCEEYVVEKLQALEEEYDRAKSENEHLRADLKALALEFKVLKDVLSRRGEYEEEGEDTQVQLFLRHYSWSDDAQLKHDTKLLTKYFTKKKEESDES